MGDMIKGINSWDLFELFARLKSVAQYTTFDTS